MKEYLLMFVVAFLSATIFPAQSEAVLIALVAGGEHSPWGLVAVATAGNSLGSAMNWLLGIFAHRCMNARWFPVSEASLRRAEAWYHRYGRWSLLLSWVPVIGDPLTLAAGVLREPFPSFLAITLTAKLLRYVVLVAVCQAVL